MCILHGCRQGWRVQLLCWQGRLAGVRNRCASRGSVQWRRWRGGGWQWLGGAVPGPAADLSGRGWLAGAPACTQVLGFLPQGPCSPSTAITVAFWHMVAPPHLRRPHIHPQTPPHSPLPTPHPPGQFQADLNDDTSGFSAEQFAELVRWREFFDNHKVRWLMAGWLPMPCSPCPGGAWSCPARATLGAAGEWGWGQGSAWGPPSTFQGPVQGARRVVEAGVPCLGAASSLGRSRGASCTRHLGRE